jgi:hypothetical protein
VESSAERTHHWIYVSRKLPKSINGIRDEVQDHKNRKFAAYLGQHLVGKDFRGLVKKTDIWENILKRYEGMFHCRLGSVCVTLVCLRV